MLVDPPTKSTEPPAAPPNGAAELEASSANPLTKARPTNTKFKSVVVLLKCLLFSFPSKTHDALVPAHSMVILLVNTISSLKVTLPGQRRIVSPSLALSMREARSVLLFALTHPFKLLPLWSVGDDDCINEATSTI